MKGAVEVAPLDLELKGRARSDSFTALQIHVKDQLEGNYEVPGTTRRFPIFTITEAQLNSLSVDDVFEPTLLAHARNNNFCIALLHDGTQHQKVRLQAFERQLRRTKFACLGSCVAACGTPEEVSARLLADTTFIEQVKSYNGKDSTPRPPLYPGLFLESLSYIPTPPPPAPAPFVSSRRKTARVAASLQPYGAGSPHDDKKRRRSHSKKAPSFVATEHTVRKHFDHLKTWLQAQEAPYTCRYLDDTGAVHHLKGLELEDKSGPVHIIYMPFKSLQTEEHLKNLKVSRREPGTSDTKHCHIFCYGKACTRETFTPLKEELAPRWFASFKALKGITLEDRHKKTLVKQIEKLKGTSPHKRSRHAS